MEKSLKSTAINYGFYLAAILVSFTVIAYLINIELLVNFWLVFLLLPIITITFGILSSAKAKGIQNGFISFKQAFSSYFIPIAVAMIISTIVSFILFNFIDPDTATMLKESVMDKTLTMMENFGTPQTEIDKVMTQMQEQDTFAIGTQIKSVAQGLIFYAVIGLLVALVMKKKNPELA